MPKVGTAEFKINKTLVKYPVNYSTTTQLFSIKLPDEMEAIFEKPEGSSQAEAEKKAWEVIRKFEELNADRRRVILVYAPSDRDSGNLSYSNTYFLVENLRLSFRVTTRVEILGVVQYLDDSGHPVRHGGTELRMIDWTPEREEFFKRAVESLKSARERIRKFLEDAEKDPTLCDAGHMLIEEGKPE